MRKIGVEPVLSVAVLLAVRYCVAAGELTYPRAILISEASPVVAKSPESTIRSVLARSLKVFRAT